MNAIHPRLPLADLAGLVCATLDRHGVHTVLSGGSVVSILSENRFQSYDLDFIRTGIRGRVDSAMREIGFRLEGRHWVHERTRYLVEFLPGPVQIGNATITDFAERRTRFGLLRMLTPTACVMDRLAWFYHGDDPQGLAQAIEVALRHRVGLARIERWSDGERAAEKFREFKRKLAAARRASRV